VSATGEDRDVIRHYPGHPGRPRNPIAEEPEGMDTGHEHVAARLAHRSLDAVYHTIYNSSPATEIHLEQRMAMDLSRMTEDSLAGSFHTTS
jgi:hypothetical protein